MRFWCNHIIVKTDYSVQKSGHNHQKWPISARLWEQWIQGHKIVNMASMLGFSHSERSNKRHIYRVSRLVDAGIPQCFYMPCDIIGILLFEDILSFRELYLTDIVGPFGCGRNDEVNLGAFAPGRFAAPTERSWILFNAKSISNLGYLVFCFPSTKILFNI